MAQITLSSSGSEAPRSGRRRWLLSVGALVVVAALACAAVVVQSGGSDSWSNQSLHVVGSPVLAGNRVIVLNVSATHQLKISGVLPASGSIAWSHPFSSSEITPGVAFSPIAIGNTVLVLAPASGSSNPEADAEGVDAATGRVLWTVPQPLVLSDAPVVCAAGKYFCLATFGSASSTALVALNPLTGGVVGAVQGPYRNMAVAPPGSTNNGTLWQTNASAPTFVQVSATGRQAWSASVASLFGGSQYDPNYGWDFLVKGSLDIGSIGTAPTGNAEALGGLKTVGISSVDGSVQWSLPGYYLCGGGLQFLTADVLCRYTGTARSNGTSTSMSGVSLTLEGLNPSLGKTTWSQPVLDAQSLSLGTNVAFADGTHVVVQVSPGSREVLDVQDGIATPVGANEVFWCEQVPMYTVATAQGASVKGQRQSEPVFRACSASGAPVSGLPSSAPNTVGVSVDGRFIWATPSGLQATQLAG
jgi:hypothetical protein